MTKEEQLGRNGEKQLLKYLVNTQGYSTGMVYQVVFGSKSPAYQSHYIISPELQSAGVDVIVCRPLDPVCDTYDAAAVGGCLVSLYQADAKGRESKGYAHDAFLELTLKRAKPIPYDYEGIVFSDNSVEIRAKGKTALPQNPHGQQLFIPGVGVIPYPQLTHGGAAGFGMPHGQSIADAVHLSFWTYPGAVLREEIMLDKHFAMLLINSDIDFAREFYTDNKKQTIALRGLLTIGKDVYGQVQASDWRRKGILQCKSFAQISGKKVLRPGGISYALSKKLLNKYHPLYQAVAPVKQGSELLTLHRPWKIKRISVTVVQAGVKTKKELLVRVGQMEQEVYLGQKTPKNLAIQRLY